MIAAAIGFATGLPVGGAGVWLVLAALVNRLERKQAFGARSHSPED